jgi:nucleoside-diphosphate-sugar epimerase
MKALVTGGTGFTGGVLAERLSQQGAEVRLLIRDRHKVDAIRFRNMEIFEGDIRDGASVEAAMRGINRVFNLAAYYRNSDTDPQIFWDIHVLGTENVLHAALKHGVERVVHCSTVGVHGDVGDGVADETQPFSPGDIYQSTKLEGELRAFAFSKQHGLPLTVIRPSAIYGPGDTRLLKLFKLANRRICPVIGDGKIYYHMVFVDDLVDAFILASHHPKAVGEAFIIAGQECLQLNDLLDTIGKSIGRTPRKIHVPAKPFQWAGSFCEKAFGLCGFQSPIYRRRVDFFTKSRRFDASKAQSLLGFSTKIPLSEGLRKTAEWYRHQQLMK